MELIKITLPSGSIASLKSFLTGREKRKLRAVFLKDVEIKTDADGKPTASGVKASVLEEAENAAIECVVVDLDQSTENLLERVLDLKAEDFDVLLKAINEVTSDKEKKG